MTTDTKRYNGWTNYETWNVKLWIDNERGDYEHWREQAISCWRDRARLESWENPGRLQQTDEQRALYRLADQLKDSYEESQCNILEGANLSASMWADLLGAALSEVNWREIAESMLEDLSDEDEDKADDSDKDS
jgi:hypothetical protein